MEDFYWAIRRVRGDIGEASQKNLDFREKNVRKTCRPKLRNSTMSVGDIEFRVLALALTAAPHQVISDTNP